LGSIQETLFNATVTAAQYLPPKVVEYIREFSEDF